MDEVYRVGGETTAVLCVQYCTEIATVNLVVISSSLTPQAALVVPISSSIDPVVDCRGFTGSSKTACKSRPGHL